MATLTTDVSGPGKARVFPVMANSDKPLKVVTGKFSFDNSYPTGGESISDIFDKFSECLAVIMQDPRESAGTGKFVSIDHTNKKAKLLTAALAEVANASDQSGAVNLRFIAWGYQGRGQLS